LYDFLVAMSADLDLQRAYALDSVAVIKKFGLTPEEEEAVFSADLNLIQKVAGSRGLVICKSVAAIDPCKPPPDSKAKK
jgi:hypothetical protein